MGESILLVDDEEAVLEAFQALLERKNYQVRCAGNLTAAEAACREAHFDAAVVDLTLPAGEEEGLAVVSFLAGLTPRPVIVAWSGMVSESVRHSLALAGADDFLAKPVSFAVLHERIHELLSMRPQAGTIRSVAEALPSLPPTQKSQNTLR